MVKTSNERRCAISGLGAFVLVPWCAAAMFSDIRALRSTELFMEFGNPESRDEDTGLYSGCTERGECLIYTEKGEVVGRCVRPLVPFQEGRRAFSARGTTLKRRAAPLSRKYPLVSVCRGCREVASHSHPFDVSLNLSSISLSSLSSLLLLLLVVAAI